MAQTGKGFHCYLLALGLSAAGAAEADWRWVNPQPQGNLLADVVHDGSGQFVAVGNSGTILTSPDGAENTWTLRESGTNAWLYAVESVGGSRYVTVGDSRTVLTGNGDTWDPQQTPGPYTFLYGVANQGNTYVAVGSNGSILYSTDGGETWSDSVTVPWAADSRPWLNDVTWADGEFVAVGADGTIITSPNGVDWTAEALDTPSSLESVAWNGSNVRMVVGSWATDASNVYISENGGPWTPVFPGTATPLNGVHWDAASAQFILVGDDGEILTFDGQNWSSPSSGSPVRLEKVGSDDSGTLVAVGDFGTILRSTDQGQNWNAVTGGSRLGIRGVAVNETRYVAVGEQGIILTGALGDTPDTAVPGASGAETLNDVAWNGSFIAVGTGGTILSGDGTNWSPVGNGAGADLSAVAPAGGGWVAVGAGGTVLTSADGSQWSARTSGVTANLADVAVSTGLHVAVGSGGTVITSSDGGETWRSTVAAPNVDLSAVTATDTGWVAVGRNTDPGLTDDAGTVLTSTDGTNWTVRATDIAEPLEDVVWSGSTLYAAGGDSAPRRKEGLLLVSTDGADSWARQSATGNDLAGLAARGNTVMAVGDGGTVLLSQCPCATDDTATTVAGRSVTIDVLANDIPGDDGAPLSILAFDDRNGDITDNGDGSLTYTPPAGFTGEDTFGYTVGDGSGNRDVGTVTVTVNQAPYEPGSGGGTLGSGSGGGGGLMAGFMLLGMWGLLLFRRRNG